jgi:hypothetical protein
MHVIANFTRPVSTYTVTFFFFTSWEYDSCQLYVYFVHIAYLCKVWYSFETERGCSRSSLTKFVCLLFNLIGSNWHV